MRKAYFPGFEEEYTERIVRQLNTLVGDLSIHYHNLRGFHWNVKGPHFLETHDFTQRMYEEAATMADDLAERINALGGTPIHSADEFVEVAKIPSKKNIERAKDIMEETFDDKEQILQGLRIVQHHARDYEDDTTLSLLTKLIAKTEKELWMIKSWLSYL